MADYKAYPTKTAIKSRMTRKQERRRVFLYNKAANRLLRKKHHQKLVESAASQS